MLPAGLLAALLALLIAGTAPTLRAQAPDRALPGLRRDLSRLIQHGGVAVGENGRIVFGYGAGQYVPASILKLATALTAFHELGPAYRFRTEFYRQGQTLYLRGTGDPFLVSEEWALIAGELAQRGVFDQPLQALVLDGSAIAADVVIDGAGDSLNPYDARPGALVSNFNTAFVDIARDGSVRSAEPQTPLTPLVEKIARTLPPGTERINLGAREIPGLRYTGELALAFFRQAGARFRDGVRAGPVPAGLEPVLVHRSTRTLEEVVEGMLAYSNNFIANQLVLVMALERSGPPARLEPGLHLVRAYLRDGLGLDPGRFTLVEGSGLSRSNRIGLEAMLKVVDAFYPWRHLLQFHGRPPLQVPAKTGTLTGVYSLAGFLPAPAGVRRPFVIMLNQPRHDREQVFRRLVEAFPGESQAVR